jgi:hypothetical protein
MVYLYWVNSCHSKIQKRIMRDVMCSSSRDSCHAFFLNLEVLPLLSQYIFPLLLFAKNRELFTPNSDIQNINSWYNSDLLLPTENLTVLQNVVFYFGIKSFYKVSINYQRFII